MAEIVTDPLPNPVGVGYTEYQLESMKSPTSRLTPIQPGDLCCHCGLDCDGAGFSTVGTFKAYRIRGHPICARPECYDAHMDEFVGRRNSCRCGARQNR